MLLVAIFIGAGYFWIYSLLHLQTNDAYINAPVVQIASRLTGQVSKVHVENNQFVQQGQVLFELDPATFIVDYQKSKAVAASAEAKVKKAEALAADLQDKQESGGNSSIDSTIAEMAINQAEAELLLANANLAQAQLNFSYTKVLAPSSGWVAMNKLRRGEMVEANKPLFALVVDKSFWVDANFKETEVQYIHIGQAAIVEFDMYPGNKFKGIVESISPGSGTAFSLLPAQNATGNWVKVTQRVPVKIRLTDPNPASQLYIGTTSTVTIKKYQGQTNTKGHE